MTTPNTEAQRAFEVWLLEYRKSTWFPLKSDPRKEMPAHWNSNCEMHCLLGWQAATEAAARICERLPADATNAQCADAIRGGP